jgi:menaquinol-cytochrome c reductase iron-sulfur subunit
MDEIPLAPIPSKTKAKPASEITAARKPPVAPPPRRGFFTKAMAVLIGGLVGTVPVAVGLATFLDPLRRRSGGSRDIRVASLDSLPADGMPRQFPVVADRQDAWNLFPNEPIGAVFLRRLPGSDSVEAFNATCPHAGCMVAYKPDRHQFQCPCHTSAFEIDGKRVMPCVAPRDLDTLPCEVRTRGKEQVIFVKFANFYTGIAEKKQKA